jgi:hypothetical protein
MSWRQSVLALVLSVALVSGSLNCAASDESHRDGVLTDTTPPGSPTNLAKTTPDNDNTPIFSWNAAIDDDSGIATYFVHVDSGEWVDIGDATAYTCENGIPDGSHIFEVKAVDEAGNQGAAASLNFTCDTTEPSISSVGVSITSSLGATITWTTDEVSTSHVEYGTTTSYGSTTALDTTLWRNHSVNVSGLSAATTYHFRVESKDASGNESVSGDYYFTTLGTQVGGIISENTTWTKSGSPYVITDTIQISLGVTLTIEPGVAVARPTSGYMFLIHGQVYAHGTTDDKITFDGGGNSDFFAARGSTADAFLDLDYCIIRNGLAFWPATGYEQYGHFSLRHSELVNLSWSYIWYPGDNVYIEYNKFVNCGGFSVGTSGSVQVYIRYNLFNGKNPDLPDYADLCIENWATYDTSETIVQYNSFVNTSGIVLKLPIGYPSAMTAIQNYWGTQDTAVIDSMIYDKKDDISCAGYIAYLPILTAPHPDTPTV